MKQLRENGYTIRAFLTGLFCVVIINAAGPYLIMAIGSMGMNADFITAGAVFLFFILGLVNILFTLISRKLAFTTKELILIYIMMIVASAIPSWGLMCELIPVLAGLFYFATPENNWVELIHPYLKPWLVPTDQKAITTFYEGLPKGATLPWSAWVIPLLSWFILMMAIYFVMVCMMVILRKQWVDKERLVFPLTQLPLEMVREDETKPASRVKPFYKSGLMWVGFAIPFILGSLNALHKYFNYFPMIEITSTIPVFRNTTDVRLYLNFPIMGLSYLLSLDVSFSLWFFHLLSIIQTGIFKITGFEIPGHNEVFCGSSPSVSHQGMGAMIVLVLYGLWAAKGHLKDVFRKAFKNDNSVDDSTEMLSYRTAVFGMLGGLIFISVWLWLSGLPWYTIPLFLFAAFIIFLGLTRIIAEGGVGFARAQCIPQTFLVYGIGSPAVGSQGLTALGLTYPWVADVRTIVMTSTINGFKIADVVKTNKKPLFFVIIVTCIVSFIVSAWAVLATAYRHGAINSVNQWFFNYFSREIGNFIVDKLKNPFVFTETAPRWFFTVVGGGVMGLLMFMRHQFLWWPVHYIGFPIGNTWTLYWAWFPIFISWLVKLIVLKYGGLKLYRTLRPMFLGFIVGQLTCAGVWPIIDYFNGMVGNIITIGVP